MITVTVVVPYPELRDMVEKAMAEMARPGIGRRVIHVYGTRFDAAKTKAFYEGQVESFMRDFDGVDLKRRPLTSSGACCRVGCPFPTRPKERPCR